MEPSRLVTYRHIRFRKAIRVLAPLAAVALLSFALLAPAVAQIWNPFNLGSRPAPPPPGKQPPSQLPQRAPQPYNPFSALFGGFGLGPGQQQQQQQPKVDNVQAPPPARRSPESIAAITTPVLVLGDAMADWLALGLEEAFAERPEFGIVRKHRSYAGLIRYDTRRDIEWPQVVREAVAADKPKFIVMMVGFHDRQAIREQTAAPTPPGRGAAQPAATKPDDAEYHDPDSPESRARASAEAQNAELRKTTPAPSATPEQTRAAATGPAEFQSEAWQANYVRRIDATIAALKSANVPVFWVGLPPQRVARQSADAAYLNELYRSRAERAGITYVDIWDGFVDEAGRYTVQGPDFEGQSRRLRSGDGLYFTRAGARKLAHYVEREILRSLLGRDTPIAFPAPEPSTQPGRPGAARPLVGPVIPLTASIGGGSELLGGGPARPSASDPLATRVLVRGEPVTAPAGRADNFAWPRDGVALVQEGEPEELPTLPVVARPEPQVQPPAPVRTSTPQLAPSPQPKAALPPSNPAAAPQPKAPARPFGDARILPAQPAPPTQPTQPAPQQRKAPPPPPRASNDNAPRPPLPLLR